MSDGLRGLVRAKVDPGLRGLARAKINLGLRVGARRPDGFHELTSIFVRLAVADELSVSVAGVAPTTDPDADMLAVVGPRPTPDPADDLVLRAAALLRSHAARPLPALAFRLVKRVPVAAGLGGGSADAAAALTLAATAWGIELDPSDRRALAERLGSDVPFFAANVPAARVEGRGERITPLSAPTRLGLLLVRPPIDLLTAEVFAAYDALAAGPPPTSAGAPADTGLAPAPRLESAPLPGPGAWQPRELAASLREANDLWPAVARLWPELPTVRERLERDLGRPVLLTGSGPTLVALYPSLVGAREAAHRVNLPGATVIATRPA
ncbi:MAG TPA: hypothetical protein VFW92_11455 [Candidatus Limnocylindrales bacterium]|nr:hypothetical protein [Candidatus Limnocylindrales bacterium]